MIALIPSGSTYHAVLSHDYGATSTEAPLCGAAVDASAIDAPDAVYESHGCQACKRIRQPSPKATGEKR